MELLESRENPKTVCLRAVVVIDADNLLWVVDAASPNMKASFLRSQADKV